MWRRGGAGRISRRGRGAAAAAARPAASLGAPTNTNIINLNTNLNLTYLARAAMSSSSSSTPTTTTAAADAAKKQPQVVHLPAEHKFAIPFEDGDQVVVEYEEREGGKVWDLVHTYTPPSKRGQGLAAQVVNGAMEHVKREGKVKVVASCWYVRDDFLPKHPEYADCLASNSKY